MLNNLASFTAPQLPRRLSRDNAYTSFRCRKDKDRFFRSLVQP